MLHGKGRGRGVAKRTTHVDKLHVIRCQSCHRLWCQRPSYRLRPKLSLRSTPANQPHLQTPELQARDKTRRSAAEAQSSRLNIPFTYNSLDDQSSSRTEQNSSQYEQEEYIAQPLPPPGKTLKINQDLLLWRSREKRKASAWQTDADKRKAHLEEAEQGLRRALALDPQDSRAYVVLGKLLVMQRRYNEARQLYTDGCVATGNTSAYIWCAWAYLELVTGDIPRSRKLFDAALVVSERHAAAWHGWGLLEKKQGNYLRARDLWTKGIKMCKQMPNPYLFCSLAVMAAQLGKTDEARAWFEEGTRTLPGQQSHVLWQAWAVMESRQGDPKAVRYLFKKSLQCEPRSRYVHLAWACWERKQGNLRQAYLLMERGITLNPTDPALYQALALLEKDAGKLEEAREWMRKGLAADPTHIPLWQAWGVMETEANNPAKARELFQQGIWADPTCPDVVYVFHAWGMLEVSSGNYELARELFKCGLKADPRSDKIWKAWISMESDLGRDDRAMELASIQRAGSYEFQIPANFTTRPQQWSEAVVPLVGSLQRWFQQFTGTKSTSQEGGAAGAANPRKSRQLRDLLPQDFKEDLKLEDVLREVGLPPAPQVPPGRLQPVTAPMPVIEEDWAKYARVKVPATMEVVQPARAAAPGKSFRGR